MKTQRELLEDKFGKDGVQMIEESIVEATKNIAKQLAEVKTQNVSLKREKAFLNRKVEKAVKEKEAELTEGHDKLIKKIACVTNKTIAKLEDRNKTVVDTILEKKRNIISNIAKKTEKYINETIIPDIRKSVKITKPTETPVSQELLNKVYKAVNEAIKSDITPEKENELNERLAKAQGIVTMLADKVKVLKRENVVLKSSKDLNEDETQELTESVSNESEKYEQTLAAAKKRILERKRRPIRTVNKTVSEGRLNIPAASSDVLTNEMTDKIINLLSD